MANGASASLTIRTDVLSGCGDGGQASDPACLTVTNVASVATTPEDSDPSNNTAEASVEVCSQDDADTDGDGVPDSEDVCPGTDLASDAADTPTKWGRFRFWSNADGEFVTPRGRQAGIGVIDTGGCSAPQIVDQLQSGKRWQRAAARVSDRYGFSKLALAVWARNN